MQTISYKAGPTAQKFHASNKVVRGFMGPVGNGKSVACIKEMLRLARKQYPNSQGLRKTRWAIIRNTNPELRTTTLNTWKQWVPERICPVVMHPIISTKLVQTITNDGTTIEMEVYFLALDKPQDVKKLLSLELTGVFINETREIAYAIVKGARERIGRYPAVIDGYEDVYHNGELTYEGPKLFDADGNQVFDENGSPVYQPCTRKSLLMDTNPPDTSHWWYQLAEDGHLKGAKNKDLARKDTAKIFDFFRGPAPLIEHKDGTYTPSPDAENIKFLPGGYQYYLDMIAGNTQDHINVQVLGNYGAIRDGQPVYPEYNDRMHCPEKHFMPIEGLPIGLGWDFGLTPTCIIGQQTDTGQIRVIQELVSDDMDVRQFARDIVKPWIQKHLSKHEIGFSFGDPAGSNRGEGEGKSSIKILNDYYCDEHNDTPLKMGFTTDPAPTNDPTRRLDAVRSFLIRLVAGGEPGFVLDKRCEVLRKGFLSGYCYKRMQVGGSEEKFRDKPDKNGYSHSHDGLQYLCLGFQGGYVTEHEEWYNPDEEYKEHGYW